MGLHERQTPGIEYVTAPRETSYTGEYGKEINLVLSQCALGPNRWVLKELQRWRTPHGFYLGDAKYKSVKKTILEGWGLNIPQSEKYVRVHPDTQTAQEIFIDRPAIEEDQVLVHGGGGALGIEEAARVLKRLGYREILAPEYSFPYVDDFAERQGIRYRTIRTASHHPLDSLNQVLSMNPSEIEGKGFYNDYGNTPFGVADAKLTREFVKKVAECGGIPIVDLAFAEVLGKTEFRNIIMEVVGNGGIAIASLSKTQGFPEERGGYSFYNRAIIEAYNKRFPKRKGSPENTPFERHKVPFQLHPETEEVMNQLFQLRKMPKDDGSAEQKCFAEVWAQEVADYNEVTNYRMWLGFQKLGFRMPSQTDWRTPTKVIISDLPDLHQRLALVGLRTSSLIHYDQTLRDPRQGYGDSAVRLVTPPPEIYIDVVKRAAIAVEKDPQEIEEYMRNLE